MMKINNFLVLLLCIVQTACTGLFAEKQTRLEKSPNQETQVRVTPPSAVLSEPAVGETQQMPLPSRPEIITQPVKPASPAVLAMLSDAQQSSSAGNLDQAVATIERALKIEPRNAELLYKLAEVRLKQEQPRLAEDLAKKSALLAGHNVQLKKQNWLLIAKARKKQGNEQGAVRANKKAATFSTE